MTPAQENSSGVGVFVVGTEGSGSCVPGNIVGQKAELVDQLNAMDEGFQLVYDNVKAELDKNHEGYSAEIKSLQGRITQIMEKSSHLMAEEKRNKDRITAKFAQRRREIGSVKKNQQHAANYYKTMNKVTSEPVFMDKKK